MRIIKKVGIEKHPDVLQQLDAGIKQAIVRCYISQNATTGDIRYVQSILSQARTADAWLECDCREHLTSFLYPRRLPDGRYTLVRPSHSSSHHHKESCPFYLLPNSNLPVDDTPLFNLLSDDNQSESLNKNLAKVLIWLLKQGEVLSYSPLSDYHHFRVLRTITENLKHVSAENDLTISDIFSTHDKYLVGFFKKLAKYDFPASIRKQGYFIGLASHVSANEITLVSERVITLDNPLYNPSKDNGLSWVLILYGESSPHFFRPMHAVSIPAYSQILPIAVSDQSERDILKQLISVSLRAKEKNESMTVTKLLRKGLSIAPGYLVSLNNKSVKVVPESSTQDQSGALLTYTAYDCDKDFRAAVTHSLI